MGVDVYGAAKPIFSDQTRLAGFIAVEPFKNVQINVDVGFHDGSFKDLGWGVYGSGIFSKIGANYLISRDYYNPQNVFYIGGKVGYARFDQDFYQYPIYAPNQPPSYGSLPITSANSWWAELSFGARVELINKFMYAELQLQPKLLLSNTSEIGVDPLFIPGFGKNRNNGVNIDFLWGLVVQIR